MPVLVFSLPVHPCTFYYFFHTGQYAVGCADAQDCVAGTFAPDNPDPDCGSTSCNNCPAGTSSDAKSSDCKPCDPGQYAMHPGQASPCPCCPLGLITTTQGATMCLGMNQGKGTRTCN